VYACWEWRCLRVLRTWGLLGLTRLPPYGSRHLPDRPLTHPPTVLPTSRCPTEDAPKGGLEPLRPSPRVLEAGRHDAGEPDAGVLHQGGSDPRGTHPCPVHGPVVPKEGYDLPGRERVPPRRGCHRSGGLPQRGEPPVVSEFWLPQDGGCDGAHYSQLQQSRCWAVVVGTGVPAREARNLCGRPDGVGGVYPSVPTGLRPPMAAVMGVPLRLGGRPGASGGVSPAFTLEPRVPVAAAMGVALRPGGRPGAGDGVFPAVTMGLRFPVAAAMGVALRPGGRPAVGSGVSPAVTMELRVPVAAAMVLGLRPGGRPSAGRGVSPAITLGLRVQVAAAMCVALRPGGRRGAGGGVSRAITLGLRFPMEAAIGGALRPGGRPGAGGGVSPANTLGLRVPVAVAMGVALTILAAVGAPHGAVAADSSMATTVALTDRRPRAVIPRAGTVAGSGLPTVLEVLAGASGAATCIGRPAVPEFGTGRVGVVDMPFLGPATVGRRPGPVVTGREITVPVGVGR